jgi:putative hydrolase of the HAD superfamily
MIAARYRHWIFDLDNTLYPASCRLFDQVEARMGAFIADFLGISPEAARAIQKRYFKEHGTTLRGLMVHHDLAPQRFLDYVHAIDVSALEPAPALARALDRLPGEKLVYTNGSTRHAENVMARLGVAGCFDGIFDIAAADYLAKPEPQSMPGSSRAMPSTRRGRSSSRTCRATWRPPPPWA